MSTKKIRIAFEIIANLRNHDGNGNSMLLLFQNIRFKRFLVFRLNLRPLRDSEVAFFQFYDLDTPFLAFCTVDLGFPSKIPSFKVFVVKEKIWFPGISALQEALLTPCG